MGTTTIETRGTTTLTYETMMHAGMEGPHLFRVIVPVRNANGEQANLELYVRAHFG